MADDARSSAAADTAGDGAAEATKKKKGGAAGLIVGLVLALGLGAGAAFAVMNGLVPLPGGETPKDAHAEAEPGAHGPETGPKPVFLVLDPMTITIGRSGTPRQLRLALSIETSDAYLASVEATRPRILDALNTLLRAVDEADLSQPWALDRLRAQMLRRIRVAADPTAIQDLLITEYVIF